MKMANASRILFATVTLGFFMTASNTAQAQSYSVTFITPTSGANCKTGGTDINFGS